MLAVSGKRQRAARDRMASAARAYAALGWSCTPGAHPLENGGRACSCDRVGCPDPGAHPVSGAWALQASVDLDVLNRWWSKYPDANIILPTGRVFDVFDVPADATGLHTAGIGFTAAVAALLLAALITTTRARIGEIQ